MICVITAGKTIALAASAFTLAWTHSVEKTRWEERWIAAPRGLTVIEGRIEGSGAGMEPPPDAALKNGVYVYTPRLRPIPELMLAASGATEGGWMLCPDDGERGECLTLGAESTAPVVLRWCEDRPNPDAASSRRP